MMQNCKMEPTDQQSTGSIQVMPTVLGNGQQIILQSLQQQLNANGQQSIQVVPILQGQGTSYIVQPQASQPQIVQLPDGQTFIYHQPVAMPDAQQNQPQIVNINGSFFQIPAQQTVTSATIQNQANAATSPPQQNQQQVVMIPSAPAENQLQQNVSNVNSFNTNNATSPPPQPSTSSTPTPVESEEEPLYVNASKSELSPHHDGIFKIFHFRTIQKNSNSTNRPREAGSSRKDPEAAAEISLRESSSTCHESDTRRRWTLRRQRQQRTTAAI